MNSVVKPIIKGVIHNRERAYLGHCLHSEHKNFQANIGNNNWFYCPICKVKWWEGSGNISNPDWPEKELTDWWLENAKMLEQYEDITDRVTFYHPEDDLGRVF